jgi:hypothetical protein
MVYYHRKQTLQFAKRWDEARYEIKTPFVVRISSSFLCNQRVVGANPTAGSLHYQALLLILAARRKSVFAI